jgi:hypothetical protein
LLVDTNVFGRGRTLVRDEDALEKLVTLVSEAEAHRDLDAAMRALDGEKLCSPEEMKVGCDLEWWTFFKPGCFSRVLYIGSGACPLIAFYVLERDPKIIIDGVDIIPHATVLCSRLAERFGYRDRLRPFTGDALDLGSERVREYDAFFISSAVRPKNDIIDRLLVQKQRDAKIYAREDETHPDFYEPVRIRDKDLLSAKQARARWAVEKGTPYPMPPGCETTGMLGGRVHTGREPVSTPGLRRLR